MKKADKVVFVENLTEELKSSKSFVLINYAKMNVKAQQELKKRLEVAGAKMLIVKNTLFKLAGIKAGINQETLNDAILAGQTALITVSQDAISPIQILGKFALEFETPKMKIGIVDGSLQTDQALLKISQLPGKDILLQLVLGNISSPLYGLVASLQGNLQKLVYILNSKAG